MSAEGLVAPERIALSMLLAQPRKEVTVATGASVDYYDWTSFAAGVPRTSRWSSIRADAQAVQVDDVLISRPLAAPRRAWVVSAARGRLQMASRDWLVVRACGADPTYLRHLLVSNAFHVRLSAATADTGSARLIRPHHLRGVEVPLPAIAVQRRIGQVLNDADELRAKRRAVSDKLSQLPEAMFADLLRDAAHTTWPLVRLVDIVVRDTQPAEAAATMPHGPQRRVRARNLTRGGLELTRCELARADATGGVAIAEGDVLIAPRPAPAGARAAIAHPDAANCIAHGELIRVRLDAAKLQPEFALAWWVSEAGQAALDRDIRGAKTGQAALDALQIPLAPRPLQEKHVQLLATTRALHAKLRASTRQLDVLLGVLRDAAFRGEFPLD